jgi:hypothetical protein
MRVVLVFPPLADASQPYSALPALAGFLRGRGWSDVELVDANVEYTRELLTAEAVAASAGRIRSRLAELDAGPRPEGRAAIEYQMLVRAGLRSASVAAGIEQAVSAIGRWDTFRSIDALAAASRLLREAMEIHAAATFPLGTRFADSAHVAWRTPEEVDAWARAEVFRPCRRFLEARVLPRIASSRPTVLGISVTYRDQVVSAVALAQLAREQLAGVPIVFGGQFVSSWEGALDRVPEVFDWCDYLVTHEGESALDGLLRAVSRGTSPADVPNLAFRRDGAVVRTQVRAEDLRSLPEPDYAGLPLHRYLAPEPVFLVSTSRGCYWSRCTFCAVSPSMRLGYRTRDCRRVRDEIQRLKERYDVGCFALTDDCVSPATLRVLSKLLNVEGPTLSWQCEVRFEKSLTSELLEQMRDAGCRNLIFGLESASQTLLERMDKGIERQQVDRILADCRRLGIAFNLQFFFGYPGETESEARSTADLARAHAQGAATFSFGTFELQRGSRLAREAERPGGPLVDEAARWLTVDRPHRSDPAAAEHVRRLKRDIAERMIHPNLGLSMNAHTLLFAHAAGVGAMHGLWGRRSAEGCSTPLDADPDAAVILRSDVEMVSLTHAPAGDGRIGLDDEIGPYVLLYSHGLDRTLRVSRAAAWVASQLRTISTPRGLADRLQAEAGATPGAERLVGQIVGALGERGFVERCIPKRVTPGRGDAVHRQPDQLQQR